MQRYQDAYPLPMIDDILDKLGRDKFFSAYDLLTGFHQIPMTEECKKYTAFSISQGHFEYNRMPFRLKIAPGTIQRMMDKEFNNLIGKNCFAYIEDIEVFGETLEEHNKNLQIAVQRIKDLGLKLDPTKCEYLKPELEYLGHLITSDGIKPNPIKIEAVKNFKELKPVKDVQSFLSLAGYYRKCIKNFSNIARPLTRLTREKEIEKLREREICVKPREKGIEKLRGMDICVKQKEKALEKPREKTTYIGT